MVFNFWGLKNKYLCMVLKFVVGHTARLDAFAAIRACEECVDRLHEIMYGQ